MINSLSPVFTLVIGILVYKRKAIKSQITGIVLGMAGASGLLYSGSLSFNPYGLYVVLATLLSGFSSNEVSKVKGLSGLQIASLSFFLTSPFAVCFFLFSDLSSAIVTENWIRNLGFIAILAILGSATALALFYRLIQDTSPVFATIVTYFIPIVATLWGISDNEHFTISMFISVLVIFAGLYIISRPDSIKIRKPKG